MEGMSEGLTSVKSVNTVNGMSILAANSAHLCAGRLASARAGEEEMKQAPRVTALAAAALVVTGLAHAGSQPATVVEVAVSAGSFQTLVKALQAAGLAETLQGEGPFTVFAPTDEAFARLPAGTLESLLEPANREKLTAILTYHVVPGRVTAAQASALDGASTVQGARLPIATSDGGLTVGGARVVTADVEAGNGVVHVIDAVLLPPQ
jgi:uncharacterized surface protein with fasciclin (FAS1) repeats